MLVCAIDPGITGAIAWVSSDGHLIDVSDIPTIDVRGKKRVNAAQVARLLESRLGRTRIVVIEGVAARQGQGVSSMFSFGYSAGVLEGVAAGLMLPVHIATAQSWKRAAGVPADKGAVLQLAQRYWPGSDAFRRKKDDGRADAALLGRWAAMGGVR